MPHAPPACRCVSPARDPTRLTGTRGSPRGSGTDLTDLGHLGHAALAGQLAGARAALVTPRWEEPFGLVVAEALACGTPVAGFRRGALPDILDASCGALGHPDDVPSLAAAIGAAVALERRACRKRAEDLFDSDAMTAGYEALYASALAAHELPPVAAPRMRRAAGVQA